MAFFTYHPGSPSPPRKLGQVLSMKQLTQEHKNDSKQVLTEY